MKKALTSLLVFAMLLSLCSCAGTAKVTNEPTAELTAQPTIEPAAGPAVETSNDPEVQRAVAYGFVPEELQGDWDTTVAFSQFCTMLKNMLSLYDNSLVPQWEKTASQALASPDPMHRDHGMLAVYEAACLMGLGQTTNGNWNYLAQNLGVEAVKGFDDGYDQWFPDCSQQAPFYDIEYKHRVAGWDYVTCSRYWCMGQTSPVSGHTVFDVDLDRKTVRPMDNLSRKEAIQAVLRLYESTFKPVEQASAGDPDCAKILADADARRDAILNGDTTIAKSDTFIQGKTFTGTAYYVSNSGKDSNNGKSPETAWATLKKVNSAHLKYGDAVFFKRGDVWYGDILWGLLQGQPGVTYSAYGEGPKPVISGSVAENAATADKWKLYYTGGNGEKIWVYYRELRDCSGVFFNGGESWANKVTPRWNGKQYVFDTGDSFDAVTGLTENLDYFSCLKLTGATPKVQESGVTGPLYLRCDAGNPGEVYTNIEFSQDGTGISPGGNNGRDMTVDNFKIVYFGSLGVSCAGYQGWTNTLVQNCEIGWCGGGITNYSKDMGSLAIANISGGAIQMSGCKNTAINNYIHHCASKALVIAIHNEDNCPPVYSDIVIKGNILEYNAAAIHLVNYMELENPTAVSGFQNISVDDNSVLYTGYGWVEEKTRRTDFWLEKLPLSSIEFGGEYHNKNDGIFITNNVFYLSKYVLVHCYMPKDNQPTFSGNTYAQTENGWLAMLRGRLLAVTENGEQYVRDDLQDKTGTVLIVK